VQLASQGNVGLKVATTTRKMNVNAMQANKMGTCDKMTPTPKKRGRPRKKFLNLADRSVNPNEFKDRSMKGGGNNTERFVKVPLTPKKRGRPRKKILNLADKTINPSELKDKSLMGDSGGEENSGSKDINCNSKRIRRAKVIFSPTRMKSDHMELPVTSSVNGNKTILTSLSVNERMEEPIRKRGRPSKMKLTHVESSPKPEERGKPTTEKPARKRGRPSKLQEDQKVIRGNSIKKVSKKVVKEVNLSEIGIEMLNNVERMSSKGNLKEHKKVEVRMHDVVKSVKRGRGRPKKNSTIETPLNSAEKSENLKDCFHCRRFNLPNAILEVGQTMAEHIVLHHGLNHDPPLCDICGEEQNPQLDFGNFIEHFMKHRLDIENAQLELQQSCVKIPEHTKAAIAVKEKIKREIEAESADEILGDTTNAIVKTSASDDGDMNLVENPYFQPEVLNIEC